MVFFDELFSQVGVPALQEQLGQTGIYETRDGTQTGLTVIVGDEFPGDERTEDFPGRKMTISTEVITPRSGEKIIILGNEWLIVANGVDNKSGNMTELLTRLVR